MGIPAIPNYLGKQFSDAAPGHRFTLYFPLWQSGSWLRELDKGQGKDGSPATGKTPASLSVTKLPPHSCDMMNQLAERQKALATPLESTDHLLRLEAEAVAPFTTGLGNEHPLENGFAFLNPYGLPYLPGSGVKGVLRAAARELANGTFGGTEGWTFEAIEALFGREGENGHTEHQRGALIFWDVIPRIKSDSLIVEVMTPHQSHYYQKSESPHESGSPNPINFLAVPPRSGFAFHVQCDRTVLATIAAKLTENDRWKPLLEAAFKHAFDWLGFGAKTAVGYGAMEPDKAAAAETERKRIAQEEQRRRLVDEEERRRKLEQMTPVDRAIREYLDGRADKTQPEINALIAAIEQEQIAGVDKLELAQRLRTMMMQAKCWKETTAAKKPEKDKDYQKTRKVLGWLADK